MSDLLPNVPDKVIDLLPNIPDKSKVDLLPDLPNINVDLLPNLPDKDKDTSLTKTITRPFKAQAFKTAEAFSRGVAGFSERVDKISKFIEQTTGLSRGGLFEESAKIWNANADKWGRRADEIGVNVVDEVIGEATEGR